MEYAKPKEKLWKVFLIVIAVGVFFYNHYVYDPQPPPLKLFTDLNDLQKQALNMMLEMTRLLFSLSTALFGFLGFFLLQAKKNHGPISAESRRDAVLAFYFAAVSMDFGYVFMEKWVELLGMGMFAPFEFIVLFPQTMQFTTFLVALLFAAALALRELPKPTEEKGENK